MADKDFKVKNKLYVNGLNNASGVVLATNNNLDSHTLLPTQYGGTGTTTSPTAGQFLYSSSGTTYSPTTLSSVVPVNLYQGTMPETGSTGQIWVDSSATALTVSPYIAPTIGSTQIPSNTTVSTIAGLTLSSPTITGTPVAPTPASGNNSNQIATTAFIASSLSAKADLNSPTFTGMPLSITPNAGANNTQIATTAFVVTALTSIPSPTITGTPSFTGTISSTISPTSTNTYDLGTSSLRWRNIYTQDLHLSNGIGDYTIVEGEENLYLTNNKNGKSYKFVLIEVDPLEVPAKSEI